MSCVNNAFASWETAHSNRIVSLSTRFRLENIVNDDEYMIRVEIDGYCFFLNMPDCLVTSLQEIPLDGRIMDLNERIQGFGDHNKPSLINMLCHILDMLEAYDKAKEGCQSQEDESECDDVDNEDSEEYSLPMSSDHMVFQGSLHWMVEQAASRCYQSGDAILQAFTIAVKANEVRIGMDLGKLLHNDSVAYGLGFCKGKWLELNLEYGIAAWRASSLSKKDFMPIGACTRRPSDKVSTDVKGLSYGQNSLVPALVEIFTSFVSSNPPTVKTFRIPNLTLDSLKENNTLMYEELVRGAGMDNLVFGLVSFLGSQLNRLPGWCALCLDSLPMEPMKLQVCTKDICLFTCQEQGVGACVLRELKTSPQVVELELAFMAAAANNATTRDVMEPFPSFLFKNREIRCRNGWFGDSSSNSGPGNKMLDVVRNVLSTLPSIEDMANCSTEDDLESLLTKNSHMNTQGVIPRLGYKLVQFCLFSSRMSMQQLTKDKELPLPGVTAQFVVFHDAPEREAKLTGRSFYAFHGSHCGNWYSILRNGIRSMSKTKYMSSGAASGEGIYCSPYLAYSARYASHAAGIGLFKKAFSCIAIVQVFDEWQDSFEDNNCYVVPKPLEERVVIRYLLVLNGHQEGSYPRARILDTMLNNTTDLAKHYASLKQSAFHPRPTHKNDHSTKRPSTTCDVSPTKRLATAYVPHVRGVTQAWMQQALITYGVTQSQLRQHHQIQPQAAAYNTKRSVQPHLVQLHPSVQALGRQSQTQPQAVANNTKRSVMQPQLGQLQPTAGTQQATNMYQIMQFQAQQLQNPAQAQGASRQAAATNTHGMMLSQAQAPPLASRNPAQAQGASRQAAATNRYGMTLPQAQAPSLASRQAVVSNMYGMTQAQVPAQGASTGSVYALQPQPPNLMPAAAQTANIRARGERKSAGTKGVQSQ